MAIAHVQSKGATVSGGAATTSLAFTSNVTAGNVVMGILGSVFDSTIPDVGDLVQSAGTAVLADFTLDEWDYQSANDIRAAVWSARVVTGGTCTLQTAGDADTEYVFAIAEFSGLETGTSRCQGRAHAQANSADPDTGSYISSGECVFVGGFGSNKATNSAITQDAAFTLIHESEDGTANPVGSIIYRIATDVTDSASWTMSSANWVAAMGVFQDPLPAAPAAIPTPLVHV